MYVEFTQLHCQEELKKLSFVSTESVTRGLIECLYGNQIKYEKWQWEQLK